MFLVLQRCVHTRATRDLLSMWGLDPMKRRDQDVLSPSLRRFPCPQEPSHYCEMSPISFFHKILFIYCVASFVYI